MHLNNSVPGNLPPPDIPGRFFYLVLEALIPWKEKITDSRHTTLTICASFVLLALAAERNARIQCAEGNNYVKNGFLSPQNAHMGLSVSGAG